MLSASFASQLERLKQWCWLGITEGGRWTAPIEQTHDPSKNYPPIAPTSVNAARDQGTDVMSHKYCTCRLGGSVSPFPLENGRSFGDKCCSALIGAAGMRPWRDLAHRAIAVGMGVSLPLFQVT